jgi:ribosome maturation factor RimP
VADELETRLSSLLDAARLDLVDLEVRPGLVRVTVDREGGIDLDGLSEANRLISGQLDELDPLPGRYTLEVSSPGLERSLRRPEHYARAIGSTVSVRTVPGVIESRRVTGTLASAGDDGFVLELREPPDTSVGLRYCDVERARTVFEWGPAERPGGASRGRRGHPARR